MDKFIAHILVVDDDDGIRSLIKKYLNENNFLVTTANSAEDASEKIKIIKFDFSKGPPFHPTFATKEKVFRDTNYFTLKMYIC